MPSSGKSTALRPPAKRAHRAPSRAARQQSRAAYTFVLPFMVVFVAMLVIPLIYAAYISVFRKQIVGGETFVGLANYIDALKDPALLAGVGRVALVLVIQVPIMIGLALLFALALDSGRVRGHKVIRVLYFVPYAVPGVISALMWGYLYGPDFGPIAQTVRALGLEPPDLLGPDAILGSIMNIVTWGFVGYNMIVMYSALRAVPTEMYEAAEIDGASQFRIATAIKIPSIRPAIMLTVVFSVIGSFQLFNEPSMLRTVAPSSISSSFTPNLYAYTLAFTNQQTNYAAAVAFLLGFVIAIVSYVVQLTSQRRERSERKGSA